MDFLLHEMCGQIFHVEGEVAGRITIVLVPVGPGNDPQRMRVRNE
jgi:hypothetical protein